MSYRRDRALSEYHLGKLYEAVSILTTHPEDARMRLQACWTPLVRAGAGVPEHLSEEYEAIQSELTKRQPKYEPPTAYNKMRHTTRTMRKQTASKLAERILDLALRWKDWLDDPDG